MSYGRSRPSLEPTTASRCGREVIIWILLWGSGSVESLISFGHGSGPLCYMQRRGELAESWNIWSAHTHNSWNTVGLKYLDVRQGGRHSFYHPDMGLKKREKTRLMEWTTHLMERMTLGPDLQHRPNEEQARGDVKGADWKELVKLFQTLSRWYVTGWQQSKNIWSALLAAESLLGSNRTYSIWDPPISAKSRTTWLKSTSEFWCDCSLTESMTAFIQQK